MPTQPSKEIETFPNPEPGRDYEIQMTCASSPASVPGPANPTSQPSRLPMCRTGSASS